MPPACVPTAAWPTESLRTRLLLLLGGDANHVEDEQKEIVDPAQLYQRCHRTKVPSAPAAQLVLAAEPQPL